MPLIINYPPKKEDKVITMGKEPVADYYPPGATEPQVRPSEVPEQKEEPKTEPKEDVVKKEPPPKTAPGKKK